MKDLVRLGILGDEFKTKFVNGKSDEILASTLYDILLARAGDAGGLAAWAEHISIHGWDSAVNSILASSKYNDRFGDDVVPGVGRAGCGPQRPSHSPSKEPSMMPLLSPSKDPSKMPSKEPSKNPSQAPSKEPSMMPSQSPSKMPSKDPSKMPSMMPSHSPSKDPSKMPSKAPSTMPLLLPSMWPTYADRCPGRRC